MTFSGGPHGRGEDRQAITVENGYAYGTIDADLHVFHGRGPVYLLLAGESPAPRSDGWLLEQPSRLLDARFQVVDFTGRDQERRELTAWREQPDCGLSVCWLYGPGGQGKSRLATEFAAASAASGWKVTRAVHGPGAVEPSPGSQDMRLGEAVGQLVLIDYADRWPPSHLSWLLSNKLFDKPVPTRVLMIARSLQGWNAVRADAHHRQAHTSELLLRPLGANGTLDERERMFAVARDCFVERYAAKHTILDPSAIPPPSVLREPEFGLTLAIHMAALVEVDARACRKSPPSVQNMAGLSAYLLEREERHWAHLFENEGLDFTTAPGDMAQTVLTAILTGTVPYTDGRKLLSRLFSTRDPDRTLQDHLRCYPSGSPSAVLEPLYPDRLAEDFVALSLPGHGLVYQERPWAPDLADRLLTRQSDGSSPAYTARAMTVLAAAAQRWGHVGPGLLYPLLRQDPLLAIDAGGPALSALAAIEEIDGTVLEAIEALLPTGRRHVDLDVGISDIMDRLTERRPAGMTDLEARGEWYYTLGFRHFNAGRLEQARAAVDKATAAFTSLSEADPGRSAPWLARCRDVTGILLRAEDRYAEAAEEGRQSVAAWRDLMRARTTPDHTYGLATALENLCAALGNLGRHDQSLTAIREAVMLRRAMTLHFGNCEPELARALDTLASTLMDAGDVEAAAEAGREAVRHYDRLVTHEASAFKDGYAVSLMRLSAILHMANRLEEAQAMLGKAIELYRELCKVNPAAFQDQLASSLSTLATRLDTSGRGEEALSICRESVDIARRTAESTPAVASSILADCLHNFGVTLTNTGHLAEAREALEEATAISRRLAALYPIRHEPNLAQTLHALRRVLHLTEHSAEADAIKADITRSKERWASRLALTKLLGETPEGDAVFGSLSAQNAVLEAMGSMVESARRDAQEDSPSARADLARALWMFAHHHAQANLNLDQAHAAVTEAIEILQAEDQEQSSHEDTMFLFAAAATLADILNAQGCVVEAAELRAELNRRVIPPS
ncbi:tetratricopeptide repeat protein [Streptomyces sp. NPDC003480]